VYLCCTVGVLVGVPLVCPWRALSRCGCSIMVQVRAGALWEAAASLIRNNDATGRAPKSAFTSNQEGRRYPLDDLKP